MFYYKENLVQKEKLKRLLRKVKVIYREVPPQMELLGNIDAGYLEDFLKMVLKVTRHPNINQDLFSFLRLHIAFKENYIYCKAFNMKMLLTKYPQELLDSAIENIETIPLNSNHIALAKLALKVIYNSLEVTKEDFDNLYNSGWSQKDVFDVIEHAGTLFRNGRILNAYLVK